VLLEHWNPILDNDQLDFTTISLILQPKTPTLSQTSYLQCRNLTTIVVQHTLTNQYFTKSLPSFNFYYRTPDEEPCSRLNYLYIGRFSGKLHLILNQNCLISMPYPRLNYHTPHGGTYPYGLCMGVPPLRFTVTCFQGPVHFPGGCHHGASNGNTRQVSVQTHKSNNS